MRRFLKGNRGSVALVLVLTTIAIITVVEIETRYKSNLSAMVVVDRRDSARAYELARAGFRWSLLRLELDSYLDRIPAVPGTNYGGKKDDLMEMQWAFPISYPFPESMMALTSEDVDSESRAAVARVSDLGGSFVSVITDESARINLNDVGSGGPEGSRKKWSGTSLVLEHLLISYRFRPYLKNKDHREILWAIQDWIDSDSRVNHLEGGIEDAEYRTDNMDLNVKNGPFYSLAEIHMLKPMNDELFAELKPFVTIYPYDARLPRVSISPVQPLGKININTAPMETIAAILSRQALLNYKDRLACAQQFAKARQTMVFRSIKGTEPSLMSLLQQACGADPLREGDPRRILAPEVERILDVKSNLFRVEAIGSSGKVEKTITSVVYRQTGKSPKILFWKVT